MGLIVHAAHASTRHSRGPIVLLRPFGDHGFRGDQKTSDRRCILQGRPNNLGWINNVLGDEVAVFAALGIEAEAVFWRRCWRLLAGGRRRLVDLGGDCCRRFRLSRE